MKFNYHPDADSLYIDLSDRPSVESREVFEGVVLDYDSSGRLVGIDTDNAAGRVKYCRKVSCARRFDLSVLDGPPR